MYFISDSKSETGVWVWGISVNWGWDDKRKVQSIGGF